MNEIYKAIIKAEDFPECLAPAHTSLIFDPNIELNDNEFEKNLKKAVLKNMKVRAVPLESGCVIFISSQEPVTIGEQYKDYPAFVSRIVYEPKKWWQFWKRKKQIGYEVMWN